MGREMGWTDKPTEGERLNRMRARYILAQGAAERDLEDATNRDEVTRASETIGITKAHRGILDTLASDPHVTPKHTLELITNLHIADTATSNPEPATATGEETEWARLFEAPPADVTADATIVELRATASEARAVFDRSFTAARDAIPVEARGLVWRLLAAAENMGKIQATHQILTTAHDNPYVAPQTFNEIVKDGTDIRKTS